jgi:hypothetical protein
MKNKMKQGFFLGGKARKNIFENNQQIKNEKKMLRKKQGKEVERKPYKLN